MVAGYSLISFQPSSLYVQNENIKGEDLRCYRRIAQMHSYLFLAPPWVTALVLPFVLVGLAGWRGPLGLMYTNILPLGLLYVSSSIRDLWRSVPAVGNNPRPHSSF